MTDETTKDKIARQDHDTLVRVEVTLNNMAQDLKALGDGLTLRLTNVESRITALELIKNEVKPEEIVKLVAQHDKDISGLKTTWKTIVFITSVGAGIISFTFMVLNQFFGLFK